MSPLLECLTTISSTSSGVIKEFAYSIFEEGFKVAENVNQKALTIRAIDLISSVIGTGEGRILEALQSDEGLHNRLHSLMTSEEKEVVNFSYGLLGDICRAVAIPKFAEWHVQTIGSSITESSTLTFSNNALTCLADIICSNPALAPQYAPAVMAQAVRWLKTKHVSHWLCSCWMCMRTTSRGYLRGWGGLRLRRARPTCGRIWHSFATG
jgi:hypothetical protein